MIYRKDIVNFHNFLLCFGLSRSKLMTRPAAHQISQFLKRVRLKRINFHMLCFWNYNKWRLCFICLRYSKINFMYRIGQEAAALATLRVNTSKNCDFSDTFSVQHESFCDLLQLRFFFEINNFDINFDFISFLRSKLSLFSTIFLPLPFQIDISACSASNSKMSLKNPIWIYEFHMLCF